MDMDMENLKSMSKAELLKAIECNQNLLENWGLWLMELDQQGNTELYDSVSKCYDSIKLLIKNLREIYNSK